MKNKAFSIILISCWGLLVYSNSFNCSFHFDDGPAIVDNFAIRDIHQPGRIWDLWPCRFITFYSFALNYHFSHLNVLGYHVLNLAVHVVSAILVWLLVCLTFLTPAMKEEEISRHGGVIALFAGLLFVSHPIQTQAVTFIWQRAASMAAMFYLASVCLYVKSRLRVEKNGSLGAYYIFSLLTGIAAMFTKEIAITLPLMVLLYEFTFFNRRHDTARHRSCRRRCLFPFVFVFLTIPAVWLFSGAEKMQAIRSFVVPISWTQYFLTELKVILTYIRLVFLPLHQNIDYDYALSKSFFEIPVLFSFLFIIMVLCWARRMFSKFRLLSFGIFWFFLTLLPESSFFPFADVIFEHRLYLPMVGFCIFFVSGIYYLWGRAETPLMASLLLVVVFYSVLTFQRNAVWKDDITLWKDASQKSPHKARVYNNLGLAYLKEGDMARAWGEYNKAIEINHAYPDAYKNRASVLDKQGKYAQSISDLDMAIKLNPGYAEAYYNRANSFTKVGRFAQAMDDYDKAIEFDRQYAHAYNNRGLIFAIQGNLIRALADFDKAIEINPEYPDAMKNRGLALSLFKAHAK